ncbi:DNA recombination and repair protein RecO [Rhodovulum sp. PH10]|uniref:DNA repair protein RecO n=1 Tax=Rhodovulum sp. PH10 TaxID=1187851 RepID=UPI00027C2D96|nr:DNA repair protein RecO [Rhodovulum sp. PH10]EJW11524.1 DNA recombination and repair protein RecO [Rhodovulum sp. PH10]
MQWSEDGIVLGVRRHGETSAIVELMTREHGRHLGLVRGGAGPRLQAVLQPGNRVAATWRARLDEHLGSYSVEGLRLRAGAYLALPHALYALTHLAALARLLPERDRHPHVHDALEAILDHLADRRAAAALVVRFERMMLAELGFGLALDRCAVSGETEDLAYVSPRTGRAVTRTVGAPWHDRLLPLPAVLAAEELVLEASDDDLVEAFRTTGFFLARNVFEPRGVPLPDARTQFLNAALRRERAKTPAEA